MNERLRELLNDSNKYALEAKKSVLGRGGEISLSAGLKDLPDAITNIPVGSSLAFKEDSTVAYRKIVPSKAEEYALVKKIGGMSYKCNNLITFPYTEGDVGAVKILQGITYTVLEDGGIHTKGTTGDGIYSSFTINTIDNASVLIPGQTYILGNVPDGLNMVVTYYNANNELKYWGNGAKLVWDSAYTLKNIYFQVLPNRTVDTILYPMLNEGTTALPYEPFFKGLRETKVTSLESRGANLLDENAISQIDITATGIKHYGWKFDSLSAGDYFVSFFGTSTIGGFVSYKIITNGEYGTYVPLDKENGWKKVTIEEGQVLLVYLTANVSSLEENQHVQLTEGEYITEYRPYKADALDTFVVPEEIFNREDWGRGVNENYHNAIEYIDSRWYYIPHTKRKVFDGTESWETYGSATGKRLTVLLNAENAYYVDANTDSICICNMYDATSIGNTYGERRGIALSADRIYLYDASYQAVADWKAHLAELYRIGNPLMLDYVVANPKPIDITDLITGSKFLKTEGGGSIIAHNEYESAVPTTIKYTVKVG